MLRYTKRDAIPNRREYWAKILLFDCLIGNTDRHHENWGIIIDSTNEKRFAPAFDNGIALGFRELPEAFTDFDHHRFTKRFRLKTPIRRNGHKIDIEQTLTYIAQRLRFDSRTFISKLDIALLNEHIATSQTGINPSLGPQYRLSDIWREFIIAFVRYRKDYILNNIEQADT